MCNLKPLCIVGGGGGGDWYNLEDSNDVFKIGGRRCMLKGIMHVYVQQVVV